MKSLRPSKRALSSTEQSLYDHIPSDLLGKVRILTVPTIPGGYDGITLGPLVFLRTEVDDLDFSALMAHELVHVQQWKDLGARRFLAIYLGDFVRGLREYRSWNTAYRAISLEREAREVATECATKWAASCGPTA